jgi:hypothetical protein
MDVAYISALSALAGSVVGGLTSGITTWLSQRAGCNYPRTATAVSAALGVAVKWAKQPGFPNKPPGALDGGWIFG